MKDAPTQVTPIYLLIYQYILSEIPRNLFDPLQGHSLSVLDFSENDIHALYPFVFSNLTHCEISLLHPLAFEALKFLRVLNLRGNKIKQLPIDIFNNFGQMTNIDLNNNLLTYLDINLILNNSRALQMG
eukprot:XP_011665669.1 PREDICTED: phospholipase A2 inhibitor-like [Strongylocentrotus purpuratus]